MMIRFSIRLDDRGVRTIRCAQDGWTLPERIVSRLPQDHWSSEATGATAWHENAELDRLFAVKLAENPRDREGRAIAPRIASYLFEALIGSDDWRAMAAHADDLAKAAAPAEHADIELALQFGSLTAPQGRDGEFAARLHALPWELLCSAVPYEKRLLTVTRLVPSTALAPAPLSWPPRVLFVLSGTLADLELRPATEAMGLLSLLESRQPEEPLTTAFRFVPQSQILESATYTKLKETVRTFRPELVHFVCHGRPGELILQADSQRDNRKSLNASELLECLSSGGQLPTIVILAACESGVMVGSQISGSLAEQLVTGGVPVVLGMAGRISSVACRLFTRALAESLFRDRSRTLVESIGLARSAALKLYLGAGNDSQPPEWALPTMYLAADVPEAFRAIDEARVNRQQRWESWVRALNLADRPLFCCREDLRSSYRKATQGDAISVVLAIAQGQDHGKTRALKEVGGWALQDGHIPLPVLANVNDWDAPTTPRAFGLELINAMEMVRIAFRLPEPIIGELIALLAPSPTPGRPQPANPTIRLSRHCAEIRRLEEQGQQQPYHIEVRDAFGVDAETLRHGIVDAYPDDFRLDHARVILLLDDGHKYRSMLRQIFLPTGRPATRGFGDGTTIVPVFVALDWDENAKMELDELRSQMWVDKPAVELKPFPQDLRGNQAFERILLHPYDENISKEPLCFNLAHDPAKIETIRDELWTAIKGIPGRLLDRGGSSMGTIVRIAKGWNVLVKADDPADLMQQFVKDRAAP